MEEHGVEGFFILFFTNYFYEIAINQAKSYLRGKEIDDDPGYVFYKFKNKIGSHEDIKKFENEIKRECKNLSKMVVERIKKEHDLEQFSEGSEKDFRKKFHEIIEDLHKEVDIEQ